MEENNHSVLLKANISLYLEPCAHFWALLFKKAVGKIESCKIPFP